ncbi:MAG: hypothetical protein GC179_10775 [Anaerolineaceae bacterium]|nr:hypothetical protein [Anaerolineaceae bacterium]
MTFFSKPKRKNDDRPPFPAWIIVLMAIGLVIIIVLLFQPGSRNITTPSVISGGSTYALDPIQLTATRIIEQATALAQGTPQPGVEVNKP